MNKSVQDYVGQKARLLITLSYIAVLVVMNRWLFGSWLPSITNKGFWFFTGLLGLLLGSRLVTPFYNKPVDTLAYCVPAAVALFLVRGSVILHAWVYAFFWIIVAFCAILTVAAVTAIMAKDTWPRLSKVSMIFADRLGKAQVVYSLLVVFAVLVFHQDSYRESLSILLAWFIIAVFAPIERIVELAEQISKAIGKFQPTETVGELLAYQSPDIFLVRQDRPGIISRGEILVVADPHAPCACGMALDYTGRDEGILLRVIAICNGIVDCPATREMRIPKNHVGRLQISCDRLPDGFERMRNDLVGLVAADTTVERLFFEVVRNEDLEEECLVQANVGDKKVIYQIIDGLTKEEIVHQKNTFGYVRAQAQKIGMWDDQAKKFKHVAWLPTLNTPVYLVRTQQYQPLAEAIGHFPKTNYHASIRNIHELVTHNTAILGILGVGKSMLGIELVERMIGEKIKVICLDLADQYAKELSTFLDDAVEAADLKTIQDAGRTDAQQWTENPEQGGSLPNFYQAVKNSIQSFMTANDRYIRVYNPAKLLATKQISEPRSYQTNSQWQRGAGLWTVTPVETTGIITRIVLEVVQDLGITVDGKARVCIVYEEAHSLVPEWNSVAVEGDKAATNDTARAILQGRKYGMGCILVTQRTANVTKTILNQCNTIFAMRSFDETGKNFLADYIGKDYADKLPLLQERHAVFFGKASSCDNPILLRLNDRQDFIAVFRKTHVAPMQDASHEQGEAMVEPDRTQDAREPN